MGRDPAAVGLLADRAAPRRLPARSPGDEARPGGDRTLHDRGPRRPPRRRRPRRGLSPPGSLPVAGVGHRPGDARAERRRAGGRAPGDGQGRRVAAGRGGHGQRRLVGARARSCAREAGPSSSPTTTTPTSTTPPRWCSPCSASPRRPRPSRGQRAHNGSAAAGELAARIDGAVERAVEWVEGMQSRERRLGRVRRRQHAHARPRAAVPGLRRGDRRAQRRRHRPRGRDVRRRSGCAERAGQPPRGALAARQPGARRLVVRALGRQPRLRHRGRRARAGGRRASAARRRASAAPSDGSSATRTKTAAGARTRAPTTTRAGSGAAPAPPPRPAWALLALHAAGERSQALARGVEWLVATQRADGSWHEPQYTGTGFPSDYYINYHLYRLTFPLMALGRCLGSGPARARTPDLAALRQEG